MPQDDLSVISFSMPGVGTVTWEMPEHVREVLDAFGEPAAQQEFKELITHNLKGFFCSFSACFFVPSLIPEMVNNISQALDAASDINMRL